MTRDGVDSRVVEPGALKSPEGRQSDEDENPEAPEKRCVTGLSERRLLGGRRRRNKTTFRSKEGTTRSVVHREETGVGERRDR